MLAAPGSAFQEKAMQRIVATFLLVLALGANVAAIAQVTSAAPAHACCRRNAAQHHQCHESAASDQLHVHSTECCNRDCCRSAATARWANPGRLNTAISILVVEIHSDEVQPLGPATEASGSQSTRAPPRISIA